MAKNTFYIVKQTQGEQDPPNFDSVFTERFLLPRKVEKMCGIRHFRKTGIGRLRHLRRLRRFSPAYFNIRYVLIINTCQLALMPLDTLLCLLLGYSYDKGSNSLDPPPLTHTHGRDTTIVYVGRYIPIRTHLGTISI